MKQLLLSFFALFFIGNSYGKDPVKEYFVKNKGQMKTTAGDVNSEVLYLWNSPGMNVQFKSDGLAFDTYSMKKSGEFHFHRMDVRFLGLNTDAKLLARGAAAEKRSVINGADVYEDVGLYEELVYKNLYENIDLITQANGNSFKYDFVLKEGASVQDIQLEYRGFDSYEIGSESIRFSLSGKVISENIPKSWLSQTGELIDVEYRIVSETINSLILGFEVCDDSHDNARMVIDPEVVAEWSTYHGDSLFDISNAVVTDSLGFVFFAGTTESLENIASQGSYQSTYAGGVRDAVLTRMNQHGLRQWSTYYGGSANDEALGLCIDSYQRLYLVGQTTSIDSIGSENSQQAENAGLADGFIAAFSREGSLIWDTYLGGENEDQICDCFAFTDGKVAALGNSSSPSFFIDNGIVPQNEHSGAMDGFVAMFSAQGELSNGTFIGGEADDFAKAIDVNEEGGLFIGGHTISTSGIGSASAAFPALSGGTDGFVFRMDTLLGVLWSSYFGGDGDDFINDIDAENDSEIFYVGGYTNGAFNLELDSSSAQAESGGLEDGFIAKLNENASHEWFTYSGGPGSDRIVSIKLDIDSSLYAVGITTSDTGLVFFDEDSVPSEFGGGIDSYLARYDDEGPRVFSRYIGGEGNDQAQSLAVFGRTAYFVAGATTSENDMVLTSENQTVAHQDTYRGGGADAFIARFTGLYTTDENICFNCGGGGGGGGSGSGSGGGGSGGSPGPPPDPAVCLGDSFLISIGSAALGSGSQWIWYNDSCGSTDNFFAEGWNVWVQPDTTTTYYVRSESAERVNPCHSFTLIVEEPFDMTASVNDSICAGEPLIFQADSALTYSWVGPDTIAFEGSPYQLDSTTALNIGWYYVTGMGLACVDVDSVEVEVIYPNPFLEADLFNPTCVGLNDGSITLSELDTTIVDFLWTDVGSDTLFRDSLPQGFYPYFAENIYGCTTNSGFGLLEPVNPIDSSTVVPDTCGQHVGAAMAFLSTGWMDNFGLAWSDGLDSNVVNPQGLASGMYYFEAFNEFGCSFEDSLFVGLFGDFTTQIIPDSLYLEFEETAGGEVFNSPEQENETYSWSPAEGLSCSDCSSPIFNPDSTVSFQVLVTSEYGCTASDTIFVEREIPPPTSFIPTIFSPNNDGLNDELCVLGNRMLEVNLSIYNRWGEEVFSTSQKESCWDGNFNGQPVSGTLVYTFTALLEEGITVEESGNIQILR